MKWFHRPVASRQELLIAGVVGFCLAWLMLGAASCVKKPTTAPPVPPTYPGDTGGACEDTGRSQWRVS